MAKLNPKARAALQSARAKNRKAVVILGTAAAEHGVKVPKSIIAKMTALEDWYENLLAAKKAAPAASEADGETESSEADPQWAERLQQLTA